MAAVFLSYSSEDRSTARALHDALAAAGVSCWRDERWVDAGDDFALEITRGIRECDAFLLLLSNAGNRSDYVGREVAIAHHFRKRIIPVALDTADTADGLLPYLVRLHRWDLAARGAETLALWLAADLAERRAENAGPDAEPPAAPHPFTTPAVRLVSAGEYRSFALATRRALPGGGNGAEDGDGAATLVSWDDALAYCDWTGGTLPAGTAPGEGEDDGASDPPAAEWCDAGTEHFKQVCDPQTARVVAVMHHQATHPRVGFRCVPVDPPPSRRWVAFDEERCALGTDVQHFTRLAALHRVPLSLRQPVLHRPLQETVVPAFALAATCVTNEEFYAFTQARGRAWPGHWSAAWLPRWGRPFPPRLASRPVVGVSAEAARLYCAWSRTRLPAWFEWERAAAGTARRPYPWGAEYCAGRCNSAESGVGSLAPADALPAGDSPEGARQLCGNVAEWVVGPHGRFELRGGSFRVPCEIWGLAYAFRLPAAGVHAPDAGFRVAAEVPPAT